MSKKVIKISLILILITVAITLGVCWHNMFDASTPPPNLIVCNNHTDVNSDMVCDECGAILPLSGILESQIVEAVSDDGSFVKVQGNMPKDTKVESKEVGKEKAITLAKKYLGDIEDEKVLYAYDISMIANDEEYQPNEFGQTVKVNISNLNLEYDETAVLLHIIDEENYEILEASKLTSKDISFEATRFSTYIVISVASHDVTFTGTGNFVIQNTKGKEITTGTTIGNGVDFNFVVIPEEGYGVTDIVVTNSAGTTLNISEITGNITSKTVKINDVTENLTITVTTVDAPIITLQPATTKVKIGEAATYTVTAQNTTTFEWQYKVSGDNYWKTVTEEIGLITTNGQTSELVTKEVTKEMQGYEFRCLLGNTYFQNDDTVKTDSALLIVCEDTLIANVVSDLELTDENVSISPTTFVYDGEEKKPTVTVTWDGITLIEDKDYTVGYANNVNVGTGTVTVTGAGIYSGVVEKTFTITEASFSGDITIKGTNTYGQNLTADVSNVTPQADSYEYVWWYSEDANATSGTAIPGATEQIYKVGSGLARKYIGVTVKAIKGNYEAKEFTDITDDENNTTAKVEKAERNITIDSTVNVVYGETGTITFTYTGEDVEATVVCGTPSVATVVMSDENLGGTLTITPVNVGESIITVNVPESENFKAIEASVTVTIENATFSGDITIKGTNTYGETLTADVSQIAPETDSYEFVWWYAEDENATSGTAIEGATEQTYTVGKGLVGKYIGVTVKAIKANYEEKTFTDVTDAENNDTAKVEKAEREVTINQTIEIEYGKTGTITFTYTGEDVEAIAKSNNELVATVVMADENLGGTITVTPKSLNETTITVYIPESENYKSKEAEVTVKVTESNVLFRLDSPTDFEATIAESTDKITVTWTNIADDTAKYELYAKKENEEWSLLGYDVSSPYEHSKLENNSVYEYRLRAYNDKGQYSSYVYTNGSTSGINTPSGEAVLDTVKPIIEHISTAPVQTYVKSGDSIAITFKVTDENYYKAYNTLTAEDIIVKIGTVTREVPNISITKSDIASGENFVITIPELPYTSLRGYLSVIIPRDKILDKALNGNVTTETNTGLTVVNSNITNTAPTLEVDANTITVTCNQTTDYEPDDVTIYYEYRKSGDTEFTRVTSNVLTDLESQTEYEVRTILEDVTGNAVTSESAFITTGKDLTAIELKVVSPETGTYVFGTEVVIEGILADGVTIVELPTLTVKFGDGEEIELVGEYNAVARVITYKYTTKMEDLGLLTPVRYVGSVIDADGETIEYNSRIPLGGNSITARTGVKLIENGVETYYPYLINAINAANTTGNISNIVMLQTEETSEAILIFAEKNIDLDLNGKDLIFVESEAIGLFNYGNLIIKDDIGTSELTAYGESSAKTIINNGNLTITSGQIKATLTDSTGEAVVIENTGTLIIGVDDGEISKDIPVIDSAEYGVVNVDGGIAYFYDGVMIGSTDKSYSGDITLPSGYDLVTERMANNREKTYIGVDKFPPVLNHTILTKGWKNDYIEVQIYAYDAETGIKFVKIDNEEIELDGTSTIIRLTENKEYILYAEDNAGNSSTQSIYIETLDKVAPEISAVTMEQELSTDDTEVIVEVQDIDSGLAGIIIKTVDEMPTNAEDWIEFNMYPTSKQFVSVTLTKNSTYYCFAKDRAGNISRYDDVIKVTNIDKVKPTIESVRIIKDEGKDYVSGKGVIVDVVAKDNIEVAEVLVSNELLTDNEVRESNDWKAYNQYIIHELPVDYDDVYTIYVWVKDATGNISLYASTSVELKTLVIGDNVYDYTGSDEIYNKTSLRFRSKDHNYDYESAVENGEIILRLTLGDQIIRNITTGLNIKKLSNYADNDGFYEGEIYELQMQNLPGTGELNLVILDDSLIDLARNQLNSMAVATDIFVDNNPPIISVVNTGTTDINGNEVREITVTDKEGYLLDFIEITTEGTTRTYALVNGKTTLPLANGSKIVAYDKAGNEGTHTVGKSVAPELTIDANVTLIYGGSSETLTYTYDGDGVATAISSDTNVVNVSIDSTTKQITISPVNAGNCEITLRTTETENFTEAKRSILVTVKPRPVTMSWTTNTFDYDGTRKFVYATVTDAILNDTVEAIAYTNNNKINAGTYRAEVVELNNNNYTVVGGSNVTLDWTINKINRTITLSSSNGELERSTTKTITFTYTEEKATAVATSADENVVKAKVNNYEGSGEIVIEGIEYGNTTVTVSIPESTNYNEATATYDASVYVFVRVYFDTDGGNIITSQLFRYNEPYGTLPTAVKIGYTFEGWFLEDTFINEVTDTTVVTNMEQHWLYAKLTAREYTLTLDANGGTVSPSTMQVTYQGTYTGLPTPTRAGYTFNGWYTTATGGDRIIDSTVVTATASHTIYAHWTANTNTAYTVQHWQQKVSGTDEENDTNYAIVIADTQSLRGTTDTSVTPAVKKYTGFTSPATQTVTIAGDGSTVVNYYYKRISYTVTLNPNGGTVSPTTITVKYGGTYSNLPTPTNDEFYTFIGWYNDITNGNVIDSSTKVSKTSDHTLYARWRDDSITITYSTVVGTLEYTSKKINKSGTYGTFPTVTYGTHTVSGWYLEATYETEITSTTEVKKSSNHTVYAKWENRPPVVEVSEQFILGDTKVTQKISDPDGDPLRYKLKENAEWIEIKDKNGNPLSSITIEGESERTPPGMFGQTIPQPVDPTPYYFSDGIETVYYKIYDSEAPW